MWDDGTIWTGVSEGELRLRRCARCATLCHPPLPMCPACQSLEWSVCRASGEGELIAWFVSTHPGRPDEPGRVVAVVRLAEGVRFVSNLIGVSPDQVRAGMPVRLCFVEVDGVKLPQFEPA